LNILLLLAAAAAAQAAAAAVAQADTYLVVDFIYPILITR
jgi:hypothetical protein